MQERLSWNWIEDLSKKIPIPYPILWLIVGSIIFVIYLIFMFGNIDEDFYWDFYYSIDLSFLCILIIYLLIGNQYLINKMRINFLELQFISGSEKYTCELNDQLENNFTKSKIFYFILLIVMCAPIIIDLGRVYVLKENILFSNNILNYYNYSIFFLVLYLLATILWIIINVSLMFNQIERDPYINFIKIDLFNVDKIGGLGQIRDFTLELLLYYSIGISLTILSYIDPTEFKTVFYEIMFLIFLLLAGVIPLVVGLESIQKIFRNKMEEEIASINEEYQKQYKILAEIISNNGKTNNEDLDFVSKSIEWLHKERAEREKVLIDNGNKYSFTARIATLTSLILPLLTLFEKLHSYGITKMLLNAYNLTYENATMASLFLQLLHYLRT